MSHVNEISRESWVQNTFPEWGTWLNDEISAENVAPKSVAMWWLGCVGLWVKTPGNANVSIDFWCGTGKRKKNLPDMKPSHQMARRQSIFFTVNIPASCIATGNADRTK